MFGNSVLIAEGEQHRMQRKLLNPAFGPGQVRDLTGVFLDKANEVGISLAHVTHS
jgi:cytochrome P450